ncbi:RmlC-like cupin domain-containing protein [Mycena maculata]|uniref:RmlC-like cupin domain-containing protein n=1 Tax=Mycena maculata TaxID=230809 RepID=A0AAD7HXX2_9AGAR|nr:RmlC-like cupin domain-containing protein [Mycena maculata]
MAPIFPHILPVGPALFIPSRGRSLTSIPLFPRYPDTPHSEYGPLRVINEDRVATKTGFGMHTHREFEIFTYVVSGELEHKDSMGNIEILKRGDIQLTSAGTGISHSEKAHGPTPVHFMQIWARPRIPALKPKYFTRHFTDDEKRDKWARVVSPVDAPGVPQERDGTGPAPVQSALTLYVTLISEGKAVGQTMRGAKGFVQVIQTSGHNLADATGATVKILDADGDEVLLREGDSAYLEFEDRAGEVKVQIENVGDWTAEVLLFDLE